MAEKLIEYYQYVENEYGIKTKMRVAQETCLPSSRASLESDSQENIDKLRSAIEKVTGERPPEL